MMICRFCNNVLTETPHPGDAKGDIFLLYICRGCLPQHNTLYRELYDSKTYELLADAIRVDEFYVIRNYKHNKTTFHKDIIGVLENSPDMEPITFTRRVHEMTGIWNMHFGDIERLKHKLSVYTTFS